MLTGVRNAIGALVLGSAVLLTPMAAPGAAAPAAAVEAQQAGLVNVNVSLNNVCVICGLQTTVQVAADIAANVCGTAVQVGVLTQQLQRTGQAACSSTDNTRQVSITRA